VTWTVFTPRFMHEYKRPGKYQRMEIIEGARKFTDYRGPFDYAQYNWDIDYDAEKGWKSPHVNTPMPHLQVDRIAPEVGEQSHWSKGVEVQLVRFSGNGSSAAAGAAPLQGYVNVDGTMTAVNSFTDPIAHNGFLDPRQKGQRMRVKVSDLHYRVRFKYPVDRKNVDRKASADTVDPDAAYLLDTPVFDDISIVYATTPRIIYMREAGE
jgi:hypothetical protein